MQKEMIKNVQHKQLNRCIMKSMSKTKKRCEKLNSNTISQREVQKSKDGA